MISRRDFLKIIGIVPVVLTIPLSDKPTLAGISGVSPSLPSIAMANQSEWHLYSGSSVQLDDYEKVTWVPLNCP